MVKNNFQILDEGQNKFLGESKRMPYKLTYDVLVWQVIASWDSIITEHYFDKNLNKKERRIPNPDFIQFMADDKMRIFKNKYYKSSTYGSWIIDEQHPHKDSNRECFKKHWNFEQLLDYLGIVPFTPSVMFNISPHWQFDSMKELYQPYMIELLKGTIDSYMKESNRYNYWSYVIECGSEGDHIHAHIVAHITPDLLKSVLDGKGSHINKGNHVPQLKKCWKKQLKLKSSCLRPKNLKGYEGALGGKYSIQRIVLRDPILVSDKLDYLIEEKKPDGHKNSAHKFCPILVEQLES